MPRFAKYLSKPWIKDLAILLVALAVFTIILINRSPNFLRPLSLALRTGFNLTVLVYFVALYVSFRLRGWVGQLLSLILTLALFALALAGLWAIGQSQPTVFNGIVPLFDASDYYTDALRLLAGQNFSVFSARRPLFAGLLSFVLWATQHDLMATLGILTLIAALACYATAKEIQRTHGAELAVFVMIILFLFYRYHAGLVMSENLGLPLGSLGFVLMWRGTADRKRFVFAVGLLLFTLALNARAGTFFMLPLLVLWSGWVFRDANQRYSWKVTAISTAFVFVGFAINLLMVRLLATPSGVPFANFSYSLYGLASGGKSWIYVFQSHPELYQLQEPYQSRKIYQMAFELIWTHPNLFVKGAFFNWSMLFSNSLYSAYSYVGGENSIISMIVQWTLFLLCALGIVKWIRKPDDPVTSLVLVSALGVFVSVPFLPPSDAYRMRPYAASIVVFGLLPGLGMLFASDVLKLDRFRQRDPEQIPTGLTNSLSSLIVISMLIAPLLIKGIGTLPHFQSVSCASGLDLVSLRFDPGTYFTVQRQDEPGLDWMPNFHLARFRRNSHNLPDSNFIAWTQGIKPHTSFLYALDFQTMNKVLLVTPDKLLPAPNTLWQVCGEYEQNPKLDVYNIFYVQDVAQLH